MSESKRHEDWQKRNSLTYRQDYTENLLKMFEITRYNFVMDKYGGLALLIECGVKTYRIEVNDEKELVEVYKKTICRNGQKHPKEYFNFTKGFKFDGIYLSLKFIKDDSIWL